MRKFSRLITSAGLAALIGAASPVWAESAPVFDVDSVDSGNAEQSQDLPMPPPPGEEPATTHQVSQGNTDGSTFVPVDNGTPPPAAQSAPAQQPVPAQQVAPAAPQAAAAPAKVQPAAADQPAGASVSTANLTPEQRMRRLEQQLNNLHGGDAAQVEALQSEVQSLRGQVEQLNHQLEKVQSQQTTPKAADNKRVADASAGTDADADTSLTDDAPPAPSKKSIAKKTQASQPKIADTAALASTDATKDQPDVAEEQKAYQTAYDLIKAKKYPDAVSTLQSMLKKYPSGQFASNAHYWLGELFGLMGKNDDALTEFSTVINKFPGSPRVSDAQLKVGLILAAQSKYADAKKTFKMIINTYPGTASSRLASEQLKQIKLAGH